MDDTRRRRLAAVTQSLLFALLVAVTGCSSTQPTTTAEPTSSPEAGACLRSDGGCLGVLSPGEYESEFFTTFGEPSPGQLAYEVGDDYWANALDHTPSYWLQPAEQYAAGSGDEILPGVYVWGDVAPAAQEFPSCPEEADPSGPTDAAGMAAWMSALGGITSTPVADATIDGRPAVALDLVLDPATSPRCSWGPFVPLVAARAGASDPYMWGIGSGERMQLYLVDVGDGHTAAVIIDAPTAEFDALVPHARALIATFEFAAG